MKKRIVLAWIVLLCVIGIIPVSPSKIMANTSQYEITGEVENKDQYVQTMEANIATWNSTDYAMVASENADSLDEETLASFQAWAQIKDKVGEYVGVVSGEVSQENGIVSITYITSYEKGKVKFSFSYDQEGYVTDYTIEEYIEVQEPLGKRIKTACINSLMCITIVFCVLVFIALCISLFRFIPVLLGEKKQKQDKEVEGTKEVVQESQYEEVTDDTELVAVITAAIMASMGEEAPADGLVISSIKRRTGSKWKKR